MMNTSLANFDKNTLLKNLPKYDKTTTEQRAVDISLLLKKHFTTILDDVIYSEYWLSVKENLSEKMLSDIRDYWSKPIEEKEKLSERIKFEIDNLVEVFQEDVRRKCYLPLFSEIIQKKLLS